ncbi:hypothetical protein [Methanosarcina barkeri]|nr:hypothetical protein [Methanosarcina barkeri]
MEELKRAKQEREDIKKEFEPVFEEEKQIEKVGKVTGMNYEKVAERYNITQIAPDSENLRNHYKRLEKDKEYRKKWKTAVSSKVEKQEAELGKKALKTLADEL